MQSQCSDCAEAGFTEAQCVRGDCSDIGEEGEVSGCGDCRALTEATGEMFEDPAPVIEQLANDIAADPTLTDSGPKKENKDVKRRAGGVLYRRTEEGAIEIAVIRAPRARRWYLPAGGIKANEQPRQAAIREVKEETGLAIVPGAKLGVVEKPTRETHWWGMEVTGGKFRRNSEVQELKFLEAGAAVDKLSSSSQRGMVQTLVTLLQTAE